MIELLEVKKDKKDKKGGYNGGDSVIGDRINEQVKGEGRNRETV